MVVIIEQGKAKIVAMPGVVVGISEEENLAIQKSQMEHYKDIGDIPLMTELESPTIYQDEDLGTLEELLKSVGGH